MSGPNLVTSVALSELRVDAVLPVPIYDAANSRVLLLGAGSTLTQANLARLQSRGVRRVVIEARHLDSVRIPSVATKAAPGEPPRPTFADVQKKGKAPLNESVRRNVERSYQSEDVQQFRGQRDTQAAQMKTVFETIAHNAAAVAKPLRDVTVESVEMMMGDMDLYVKLALDPQDDNSAYQHCLRVGQLAMAIATTLGHGLEPVQHVGLGCLISRSGMSEKTQALVAQARKLTAAERFELQKNPWHTFDIVQDTVEIPLTARQVAYQISERWNGSGYPRGRSGAQIHPLARVAAIADVYVALTSPRPQRPAFSPYKAVEILIQDTRAGLFDPEAIRGFLKTVGLYPVGCYVRLNDLSVGVVVRTNPDHFDRPRIRVLVDADGNPLGGDGELLDLSGQSVLQVAEEISAESVAAFVAEANARPVPKVVRQLTMNFG